MQSLPKHIFIALLHFYGFNVNTFCFFYLSLPCYTLKKKPQAK